MPRPRVSLSIFPRKPERPRDAAETLALEAEQAARDALEASEQATNTESSFLDDIALFVDTFRRSAPLSTAPSPWLVPDDPFDWPRVVAAPRWDGYKAASSFVDEALELDALKHDFSPAPQPLKHVYGCKELEVLDRYYTDPEQ